MLTLGSCTDLSETIYSEIASEQYEFSESDNQGQFATVYSSLRDFYWAWYGYADWTSVQTYGVFPCDLV